MPTKKKANPILKKIVAEAKRIQKAHPQMKWTNAIKDAAKHIKSGAKTVVKKKSTVSGIRSEAKDLAKRAVKKAASKVKSAAKKSVKSGLLKLAHSKYLSGIGNLNNSLIEEIKRANRGIEQCEHQIIGLKERLKTSENKPLIRAAIKRMMENKKYYKTILAKAKKQLK